MHSPQWVRSRRIALACFALTLLVVVVLVIVIANIRTPPAKTRIAGDVLVERVGDGGFRIGRRLADGQWWLLSLKPVKGTPGGYQLPQLNKTGIATRNGSQFDVTRPILSGANSAYEYAMQVRTGKRRLTWVGNVHGYDKPRSMRVSVDGDPVTRKVAIGKVVTLVRRSRLAPPGGPIADVTTKYQMTTAGLTVSWRMKWRRTISVRLFYAAMLPVNETFSRGRITGARRLPRLTVGKGGAAGGVRARSTTVALTDPGAVTASVRLLDPAVGVDGWTHSGTNDGLTWIEDRTGNALNKVYVTRVSASRPTKARSGSTWRSSATYNVSLP